MSAIAIQPRTSVIGAERVAAPGATPNTVGEAGMTPQVAAGSQSEQTYGLEELPISTTDLKGQILSPTEPSTA